MDRSPDPFRGKSVIRRSVGGVAIAALAVVALGPASALAAAKPTKPLVSKQRHFVYFLPKAAVTVQVSQRLVKCPVADNKVTVATTIAIKQETVADPTGKVTIDARAGFLAKRTVKLGLTSDGMLQSFNSEVEGQGGKVIGAVAKLALTVGTSGLGVAPMTETPQQKLKCTDEVEQLFADIKGYDADIREIEARIVSGAPVAGDVPLLERRRTQRANAREALTLVRTLPVDASAATLKFFVTAVQYKCWFNEVCGDLAVEPDMVGRHGFLVTITPDKAMHDALKVGMLTAVPTEAVTDVVYRRPVPATVTVKPCGNAAGAECTPDISKPGEAATSSSAVTLPQLSGLFTIPVGKGGLFGSRQATAKFDASGAPIALEYGSGGASADIAGLVDTANGGFATIRDAELTNLNRQIALEEARKKLADLRDPPTED